MAYVLHHLGSLSLMNANIHFDSLHLPQWHCFIYRIYPHYFNISPFLIRNPTEHYRPVLQVVKFSVLLIQLDINAIGLKTSSYEVWSQVSPGWRTILLASLSVGCGIYTISKTNRCLNILQLPYWKLRRWWYRVAYDYYQCHAHLHTPATTSQR